MTDEPVILDGMTGTVEEIITKVWEAIMEAGNPESLTYAQVSATISAALRRYSSRFNQSPEGDQ